MNRDKRGCAIHSYCLENGLDYHEFKPAVCWQWPIFFEDGLLFPAVEVRDDDLICLHQGLTLYRASRGELGYYFGESLIAELDALEARILSPSTAAAQIG